MYKPIQFVDWFYTETGRGLPQSTTHETLELGIKKNNIVSYRKRMNYQNFHFGRAKKQKLFELPLTTSYKRDYAAPFEEVRVIKTVPDDESHHLWNRLPLNDFALKRLTASEFKFMDDHLFSVSQERQNINFIRQIRNQHVPFA